MEDAVGADLVYLPATLQQRPRWLGRKGQRTRGAEEQPGSPPFDTRSWAGDVEEKGSANRQDPEEYQSCRQVPSKGCQGKAGQSFQGNRVSDHRAFVVEP